MNIPRRLRSIERWVRVYEDLLKEVDEDEFVRNPPDGGWSYSEVFSHIFQANLACLIAIEKCALGTATTKRGFTSPLAAFVLFIGRLPRGIKSPQRTQPVGPISREEASNLIAKFKNKLEGLNARVKAASSHQKIKHPLLGYLNARQWLRFIEIHTAHHTRQLERISLS